MSEESCCHEILSLFRRVVLRLGPENRRVRNEHHLARVAALRQHAKVDVADNAGTVVLAEEHCGNAVLQFLFADGGLMSHGGIIAKALLFWLKVRVVWSGVVDRQKQ